MKNPFSDWTRFHYNWAIVGGLLFLHIILIIFLIWKICVSDETQQRKRSPRPVEIHPSEVHHHLVDPVTHAISSTAVASTVSTTSSAFGVRER
ncbi:hypothetical protein PAPYR_8644 [Paratrimastix pyriformis]|uniref:ATP synthase F0 subunit 8 n=1 Tax=Paratrimastix pyriformis TaxID=342808 RepID=A0ABQ8UBN6_9EUKA|nr:hypothetical protein PAPYR_8644 [Paratrimastix pyriformis]